MMNKMTRVKAGALRGPFVDARWLEVAALAFGLLALALLTIPHTAHGQGIVRGAQQGAYEGSRVAGPVGGVVGGAVGAGVGGAVGAVEGVFGIPYRGHYRCRGYYNRYGHFHCYR
jgi:hypothetical protein